jgi:hypothetical protein
MNEDVLRSLGLEPVDTSQLRARLVEAGQALAGGRLTETSRDGQVQATVDGTGVLLGLVIADRQRTSSDAPGPGTAAGLGNAEQWHVPPTTSEDYSCHRAVCRSWRPCVSLPAWC